MQTIGAFQAKTHFSALLEQVERGEQIVITKHGHPVAKLVPAQIKNKEKKIMTIQSLKKFNQSNDTVPSSALLNSCHSRYGGNLFCKIV